MNDEDREVDVNIHLEMQGFGKCRMKLSEAREMMTKVHDHVRIASTGFDRIEIASVMADMTWLTWLSHEDITFDDD